MRLTIFTICFLTIYNFLRFDRLYNLRFDRFHNCHCCYCCCYCCCCPDFLNIIDIWEIRFLYVSESVSQSVTNISLWDACASKKKKMLVCFFLYQCFYPHWSKVSISLIFRIFYLYILINWFFPPAFQFF